MNIKKIYSELDIKDISNIFSSDDFKGDYHFDGELGLIFKREKIIFRVWSPVAKEMFLDIYKKVDDTKFLFINTIEMNDLNGIFECETSKNIENFYYKFRSCIGDKKYSFVAPYAKACSVNGEYGMILNFRNLDIAQWNNDKSREIINQEDAIIYEMNIRDFTISKNSGVINKGKFLGFTEENTKLQDFDISTGLEHLKELGVTHIHLMPVYDFETIDETSFSDNKYNWGYDPLNYNCLEGSYSTNPFDGEVRVKEFREMIKVLHDNGFNIVLDVVFNHTYFSDKSNLNKAVPNYYYRQDKNGNFSNGSGCGNELATERSMVRKYILDSLKFYVNEYHIDGFRFDLMGLYDIETLKQIRNEMDKINPNILLYGEGWTCLDTPLFYEDRCIKENISKFESKQIAMFNDNIRDAIKGSNFNSDDKGFVSGVSYFNESIKNHILFEGLWAGNPKQMINYESAHDNYTLWDKLYLSNRELSIGDLIKLNKLSFSIIILLQGIPFMHSGEEFLRTKLNEEGMIIENSYNSSDYVNKIEWARKAEFFDVFLYYKNLIAFRKKHKCFKLGSKTEIAKRILIIYELDAAIGFRVDCTDIDDEFKEIIIVFNANTYDIEVTIMGVMSIISDGNKFDECGIENVENKFSVSSRSCIILARKI